MESTHSIIIIKINNKYLNYYDERWGMYLFPNIKGNNIEDIKKLYNTEDVDFLFDKVHDKFSVSHNTMRTYHHYFFEVNKDVEGKYFTLDELLELPKVKENNSDIIRFIKDYYKEKTLTK